MTMLTRRAALTTLSAAAAVAALPVRAAANHAVAIQNMRFNPADLAIKVGDSVTFTNMDGAPHTATADAGAFDTGKLTKGSTATLAFPAKGDFAYHCNIHRSMKAIIRVG